MRPQYIWRLALVAGMACADEPPQPDTNESESPGASADDDDDEAGDASADSPSDESEATATSAESTSDTSSESESSSGENSSEAESGTSDEGNGEESSTSDEGDSESTGGGPSFAPRLVVADSGGVKVWSAIDSVSTDTAADITPTIPIPSLGVASIAQRLIALSDDATNSIYIYDDAHLMVDDQVADEIIPSSSLPMSLSSPYEVNIDAGGHLWIVDGGGITLFEDAANLTATSDATALFTHNWGQVESAVYDPVGDKLLGGQVSGADVVAWDEPDTAAGTVTHDWALGVAANALSDLSITSGDLFAAASSDPYLRVWRNIASLSATTAPDLSFTASTPSIDNVWGIHTRDRTLVVVTGDAVLLYADIDTLTGTSSPDQNITHTDISNARNAILDGNDTLYVHTNSSIVIVDDASTTPTYRVTLTGISAATNYLVLE